MSQNEALSEMGDKKFTSDKFLDGRVMLFQPRTGFRAGLDSVLLAASVNRQSGTFLDMGAGAGAASCCVLADLPDTTAVLLDKRGDMLDLAGKNLARNDFSARAKLLCLDVTSKGAEREKNGLATNRFDTIIANPPFFDRAAGTSPQNSAKADAHQLREGELDLWVKTAATSATANGEVIFIHLASSLPELLNAFSRRFGALTVWPVQPRESEPASRILLRGIKGSRKPLTLLPAMVLHEDSGNQFRPEIAAIFRGQRRLDW